MVQFLPPESSPLSQRQHAQFVERGYCLVENLFSAAEIKSIENFFAALRTNGTRVFDEGSRYEEIDPTKRQLRAMHPHRFSAAVRGWALNPKVIAVLGLLFGKAPLLVQTMYYYKPPGAKGQGMHQDNFYLLAAPSACIAAWTAIDDAEIENGCLYVAPGSHRKELICPAENAAAWMNYGDTHIKPFPKDVRPVPVTVKRGQTMFFGGRLIHGSGPNRSVDRSRRTFIGHYIDEASEQVARFYHPVLDATGQVVSRIRPTAGGGPCGDGWAGAVH